MSRGKYSNELKLAVVEEYKAGAKPKEIAAKHGVGPRLLRRWRERFDRAAPAAPRSKRGGWRGRGHHSVETKRAALHEWTSGGLATAAVLVKYNITHSTLYNWSHALKKGKLGPKKLNGEAKPAKSVEHVPVHAGMTPEKLFGSRVQKAIITLRDAWKQVEEMQAAGKLKEPDTAHLLAQLALKYLQGDYGR